MTAHAVEHAVPPHGGDKLLSEQGEQHSANDGQIKVVDLEQAIELHRRSTAHDFAAAKDYHVVGYQGHNSREERGHWRRVGYKAEILRLVTL